MGGVSIDTGLRCCCISSSNKRCSSSTSLEILRTGIVGWRRRMLLILLCSSSGMLSSTLGMTMRERRLLAAVIMLSLSCQAIKEFWIAFESFRFWRKKTLPNHSGLCSSPPSHQGLRHSRVRTWMPSMILNWFERTIMSGSELWQTSKEFHEAKTRNQAL